MSWSVDVCRWVFNSGIHRPAQLGDSRNLSGTGDCKYRVNGKPMTVVLGVAWVEIHAARPSWPSSGLWPYASRNIGTVIELLSWCSEFSRVAFRRSRTAAAHTVLPDLERCSGGQVRAEQAPPLPDFYHQILPPTSASISLKVLVQSCVDIYFQPPSGSKATMLASPAA